MGALKFAGLACAAAALGLASPARATAGNGIRLGGSDGRLHPFVELEGRYDSNAFYRAPGEAVGDTALHVRPGFTFTLPDELTTLELRAVLDRVQYFKSETKDLSRTYGEAALGVDVNTKGTIGVSLDETFRRSDATSTASFGQAAISNYNVLSLAAPWRPGGGALQLTLLGDWTAETFEKFFQQTPCAPGSTALFCQDVSKFGYNDLRGGAELRWRFLPRTAFLLESSYFARTPNSGQFGTKAAGVRVEAGATGLITSHFAATLKGGYEFITEYDARRPRFRLLTVEGEWIPLSTASVKLGYTHDFGADANKLGLYGVHRASLDAHWLLLRTITLKAAGWYEFRSYTGAAASSLLEAKLLRVEPSVEGEVARWLRLGVGYAYTERTSKRRGTANELPGFDYTKNEAFVRATFTY